MHRNPMWFLTSDVLIQTLLPYNAAATGIRRKSLRDLDKKPWLKIQQKRSLRRWEFTIIS
jgi:hypothetical protein